MSVYFLQSLCLSPLCFLGLPPLHDHFLFLAHLVFFFPNQFHSFLLVHAVNISTVHMWLFYYTCSFAYVVRKLQFSTFWVSNDLHSMLVFFQCTISTGPSWSCKLLHTKNLVIPIRFSVHPSVASDRTTVISNGSPDWDLGQRPPLVLIVKDPPLPGFS